MPYTLGKLVQDKKCVFPLLHNPPITQSKKPPFQALLLSFFLSFVYLHERRVKDHFSNICTDKKKRKFLQEKTATDGIRSTSVLLNFGPLIFSSHYNEIIRFLPFFQPCISLSFRSQLCIHWNKQKRTNEVIVMKLVR